MEFALTFIQLFFLLIYFVAPLLLFLCLLIVVVGLWVGRIEGLSKFDALYWSFITATTVGYGDIRPLKKISKILSVLTAMVGLMFAGILVAVTVSAATTAFEKHVDINVVLEIQENIK